MKRIILTLGLAVAASCAFAQGPSGSTPTLMTSTAGGLIGDGHFDFMGLPNKIAAGVPFSTRG